MLKCISHFKRLNTPLPQREPLPPFITCRSVRNQVVNEQTRSVKIKVELKTVDRAEEMRPYRVSDFSLDNLIAVGVKMTPTFFSASPHKTISDMAATLDSININPENN